ncbi:MAG TPA: aminomethyl-transferring glycine dehydrogenase subunit GcvPB [Candidatus Jeotgalibaca pullicola]|nr:aminomethyl-transferring glycine dehydrogenase subunit GcvPB [Candidatus Jeotgalibaca pullicola]
MNKINPLIFELSREGRVGYSLPQSDVAEKDITEDLPEYLVRKNPARLPEISELQLMRHYTQLSQDNFGVENGFYPLGSCTMKYNPKINEVVARLDGFANIHPEQPSSTVQGALQLMHELQEDLKEITGMDAVSLQPAAGAHGEWTGLMMVRAFHEKNGDSKRTKVFVPDSAHGTNPSSANIAGYDVVSIPTTAEGLVDTAALREKVGDDTAALMLTNPNTLGLFEKDIVEIAEIIHDAGGLLYYDGANLNAIMAKTSPGLMGFDIVHLNLHKTFSTPHGGGGPGAGPVGVKEHILPFLPVPRIKKESDSYQLVDDYPDSIGRVKGYHGNFGVLVRAYAYIRTMGPVGLKKVSESAVLHANYLAKRLQDEYDLPHSQICKHEFVLSGKRQKKLGIRTADIAKRLLDYGYYAPTVYFPLIVEEAMMIEPTETESKETLDDFADTMLKIAEEVRNSPELVQDAPHNKIVTRLDETRAARKIKVNYFAK